MRWKISRHGHDPRQIDLFAIIVILIAIGAAYVYFTHRADKTNSARATALPQTISRSVSAVMSRSGSVCRSFSSEIADAA